VIGKPRGNKMRVNRLMIITNKKENITMNLKRKKLLQVHGIILCLSTLLYHQHLNLWWIKTITSKNRDNKINKVLLHPNNNAKTNHKLNYSHQMVKIHRLQAKCRSTSSWFCLSIKLNKIDNMSNPYLNNKVLRQLTMKNPQ